MTENIQIAVTDVTIYGKQRCVAGWDINNYRMIRPVPIESEFWDARYCGVRSRFHPGRIVSFFARKAVTNLPHNTEDWLVVGEITSQQLLPIDEFQQICKQILSHQPQKIFGENLVFQSESAFVNEGANCGSLSCLELKSKDIDLIEQLNSKNLPRLRACFTLQERKLNLSITAKDLRQKYESSGLEAARDIISGTSHLHIRLGLARAIQNGRCYLQINGIYPT